MIYISEIMRMNEHGMTQSLPRLDALHAEEQTKPVGITYYRSRLYQYQHLNYAVNDRK